MGMEWGGDVCATCGTKWMRTNVSLDEECMPELERLANVSVGQE